MFEIFDGEGEALIQERSSDPEFVSEDGITRWRRGGPIFEQGLLRKLKRDAYDDFEDRSMLNNGIMRSLKRSARPIPNVHTDGLLRSVRSVDKRSLVSIPWDENGQEDEQTAYFVDEKQARGFRSALPEEIRASLMPHHPYDGLALRYL